MPTIGAIADMSGNRMRFFKIFAFGGAIFASTFYFANSGDVLFTLGIYFLAQLGATGSNVFYDSVLKDITTDDTIDSVSARGYALGYLGGGTDLILSFVIILLGPDMLGIDTALASKIAISKSGLWWLIFSVFSFSRMNIVETKSGKVSIANAYTLFLNLIHFFLGWFANFNKYVSCVLYRSVIVRSNSSTNSVFSCSVCCLFWSKISR